MSLNSRPVYDGNKDRVYSDFASGQWLEHTQVRYKLYLPTQQNFEIASFMLLPTNRCAAEVGERHIILSSLSVPIPSPNLPPCTRIHVKMS